MEIYNPENSQGHLQELMDRYLVHDNKLVGVAYVVSLGPMPKLDELPAELIQYAGGYQLPLNCMTLNIHLLMQGQMPGALKYIEPIDRGSRTIYSQPEPSIQRITTRFANSEETILLENPNPLEFGEGYDYIASDLLETTGEVIDKLVQGDQNIVVINNGASLESFDRYFNPMDNPDQQKMLLKVTDNMLKIAIERGDLFGEALNKVREGLIDKDSVMSIMDKAEEIISKLESKTIAYDEARRQMSITLRNSIRKGAYFHILSGFDRAMLSLEGYDVEEVVSKETGKIEFRPTSPPSVVRSLPISNYHLKIAVKASYMGNFDIRSIDNEEEYKFCISAGRIKTPKEWGIE